MKTTFKFIIAAIAAVSVFSSCQKELANETVNNTTGGVRTIAVQFDNSTKATLDGFTPKFANGDAIRVSNSQKSEECSVTVSGTAATFTTTLSGALTAIYPADAAVLDSEATDAPIASSNNFKVFATQDGTVEKAIIASATVAEGENTATFNGLTALFQITPPSGVTTFKIKSLNTIDASTGQRSTAANAVAINTEGADEAAKREITVAVPSGGTAYVALKAGVNLSDLSFEYITDATNGLGAMKGIPTNDIKALASSSGKTFDQANATAANTKYTINGENWHPYVKIQMTIDGDSKTYKWATMNIGATSAAEAGTYFAWGDIVGQTWSGGKWSGSGFSSAPGIGNPATLPLEYDAANANWGGSWRMPTEAEFNALGGGDWGSSLGEGREFGTYPNTIFLPAAGNGSGSGLGEFDEYGHYWSSSLDTGHLDRAYHRFFENDNVDTNSYSRSDGLSVRAVSE